MNRLPDQQPYAPQAGQPDITPAVAQFLSEVEEALAAVRKPEPPPTPTAYKDPTPVPAIGTAPPIAQPGRPPMSQRAVDLNTTILSSTVLVTALGGAASLVMWASGHADPTVIKWVCSCAVAIPAALAVPVLALKSLAKSAKEVVQATPPEIHQHYNGHVHQDNRQNHLRSDTRGVIAVTRNELPPAR